MSNCQTFGLAASLNLMCPGVIVKGIDAATYRANTAAINQSMGEYHRVIVQQEVEAVPGADFSGCRTLSRLPSIYFAGFHPDIAYITYEGDIVRGPLGHYFSMISLVAYEKGFTQSQAAALYCTETYKTAGYLNRWNVERDQLLRSYQAVGIDLLPAFLRWSRAGNFMYSVNHPRMQCIYDVAELFALSCGVEVEHSDVIPQDSLVASACYPVYPELAAATGSRGSYLFKRGDGYRHMNLAEFIEQSFEVFSRYPRGGLKVFPFVQEFHDRLELGILAA